MQQRRAGDPVELGPYRLVGRLGAGGMGVVYLGVSRTADKYAVKVINPGMVADEEFRARFASEVDILKTVIGSRVARLERADLEGDRPWLAVQYVPGRTLQRQIEEVGPLDVRTGSMLGALLAEGLLSVQDAGLVHRDLKPGNIMLGPSGPIVIDFGLARLRENGTGLTATGQPVGTFAYMSPEQARGDRELTTATDVYALGATLVYALTGHTVYPQTNHAALIRQIDSPHELPDTSGVPTELRPLVDSMLGYEADTRPSLNEVLQRLIDVATAGGVPAEVVRAELATRTFVEEELDLSGGIDNPTKEDTDSFADEDDPTRLPSLPAVPDETSSTAETEKEKEPPETREPPDVAWLVEEMRTAYARRATL